MHTLPDLSHLSHTLQFSPSALLVFFNDIINGLLFDTILPYVFGLHQTAPDAVALASHTLTRGLPFVSPQPRRTYQTLVILLGRTLPLRNLNSNHLSIQRSYRVIGAHTSTVTLLASFTIRRLSIERTYSGHRDCLQHNQSRSTSSPDSDNLV